jgi:Bax protein
MFCYQFQLDSQKTQHLQTRRARRRQFLGSALAVSAVVAVVMLSTPAPSAFETQTTESLAVTSQNIRYPIENLLDSAEFKTQESVASEIKLENASVHAREATPLSYSTSTELSTVSHKTSEKLRASAVLTLFETANLNSWPITQQVESSGWTSFPKDMNSLAVSKKKQLFVQILLPAILAANADIHHDAVFLTSISSRLPELTQISSQTLAETSVKLSDLEQLRLLELSEVYRTDNLATLRSRVKEIPPSLALGQAALESGWGSSRFTKEANNLFGMWTWGSDGLVPKERIQGRTHRLVIYDSIQESIAHYMLTLNRHAAYLKFRELRNSTQDSSKLLDGLLAYSERGEAYLKDVRTVMRVNKMAAYDTCVLVDSEPIAFATSSPQKLKSL